MKLIVGLGNPGIKYKKTRHNIGFMFIESLCEQLKKNNQEVIMKKNLRMKCEIGETVIKGQKVIIMKPLTYMNLSGEAVVQVIKKYNIDISDMLVIHDDLDLPVGKVRIRENGSSGGQKGMNNIIDLLKTKEIKRIRIGIDKPSDDTIDYVLGKFCLDDSITINLVLDKSLEMIESFISMSFANFMSRYN